MLYRDKHSSLFTITGVIGFKKLIPRCSMSGFGPSEKMVLWPLHYLLKLEEDLYTITGIKGFIKLILRCSMSGFGPSEKMVLWQIRTFRLIH